MMVFFMGSERYHDPHVVDNVTRACTLGSMTKRYSAEPDPSFTPHHSSAWRLRAWPDDGEPPWTIGSGMTEEEARACERALSELPGSAPIDMVARRRVEGARASVVSSVTVSDDGRHHDLAFEQPAGQASSAPFVPYSPEDVAEVEKVARWFLERKLAPSANLTEALARTVLTLVEMSRTTK